jgi:subtilisin family serine protease
VTSTLSRRVAALALSVAAATAGWAGAGAPAGAAPPADPDVIPGAYIVTLDAGDPDAVAADHGRRHGAQVDHVYRSALRGYAARMSDVAAARVAGEPGVASVVPDRRVSITAKPAAKPGGGGGTPGPAQTLPTGIDRIDGDLSSTLAGNGSGTVDVDVAVIDTGSGPHPDLTIAGGKNCSSGSSYNDGNGHGTHVAGTIGAKDDASGVVGVAPGARIWSVRVLNNAGSGSWSSIICGVDWVTGHNDSRYGRIEVANMSLGGTGSKGLCADGGMHLAICNSVLAGVTYVVAAGNESDDAANHVPAAYDEVITVSALADFDGKPGELGSSTCRSDVDDTFADFSNYGADVDLIAPGVCILSTWKGGGYNTISGTSMASPHVAGAAALYKASNGGATPAQVKAALQNAGTTDWNDLDDPDPVKEKLLHVATL